MQQTLGPGYTRGGHTRELAAARATDHHWHDELMMTAWSGDQDPIYPNVTRYHPSFSCDKPGPGKTVEVPQSLGGVHPDGPAPGLFVRIGMPWEPPPPASTMQMSENIPPVAPQMVNTPSKQQVEQQEHVAEDQLLAGDSDDPVSPISDTVLGEDVLENEGDDELDYDEEPEAGGHRASSSDDQEDDSSSP